MPHVMFSKADMTPILKDRSPTYEFESKSLTLPALPHQFHQDASPKRTASTGIWAYISVNSIGSLGQRHVSVVGVQLQGFQTHQPRRP